MSDLSLRALLICSISIVACGRSHEDEVQPEKIPVEKRQPQLAIKNACVDEHARLLKEEAAPTENPSQLFQYEVEGIPICRMFARDTHMEASGMNVTQGMDLENRTLHIDRSKVWPSTAEVEMFLSSQGLLQAGARFLETKKCWWLEEDKGLTPSLDLSFKSGNIGRRVIASNMTVFAQGPLGFDATGTAQILTEGEAPKVTNISLNNLDDSGQLSNKDFRTIVPRGIAAAKSAEHQFVYETNDVRFPEVAAFANAQTTLDWFRGLAGKPMVDETCFPIDIYLHTVFGSGSVNNATYLPVVTTDTGRPEILIGDGDGIDLKNLATDPDVISHEFGHHVIFHGIRDLTDYESVVIHEAMADFFTFARTGNTCLGESICPKHSSICYVENRCLRTADNTLKLTDDDLPYEAHERSQFLSGLLWDIGQEISLDRQEWSATVMASIGYLLPRSTYEDLIKALLLADHDRHNGAEACVIIEQAKKRGLTDRLAGVNCADFQPH